MKVSGRFTARRGMFRERCVTGDLERARGGILVALEVAG